MGELKGKRGFRHLRKRAIKHVMRITEKVTRGIRRTLMAPKDREALDAQLNFSLIHGNHQNLERLVRAGANPNTKTGRGSTLLMIAAHWNQMELAKILISHHADVNAKDDDGITALMEAAGNGHLEMVKLLLEHGADAYARDKKGRTALGHAMENKRARTLEFLKYWHPAWSP
jgi:ankyrin repeat protein